MKLDNIYYFLKNDENVKNIEFVGDFELAKITKIII